MVSIQVHSQPVQALALNTLSPAESASGWKLLSDGKSNTGWVRPDGSPGKFTPEDSTQSLLTAGGDICTNEEYADFEFSVDYKYDTQGNSGLFMRTKRGIDPPYLSGMEVAIQDNGRAGNNHKNGDASVYDVKAASKDMWTGPFKWNRLVVWMSGSKLEHWHNGEKVIDLDMASDEWKGLVAQSKFTSPEFAGNNWGKETKGQTCLQDHGAGHKIWFRNLKIRPFIPGGALPAPTITLQGSTDAKPFQVKLEAAVTGAEMHFTLDGSAPDLSSSKYSGPITISSNQTLKAITTRPGFANSSVRTWNYQGTGTSRAEKGYGRMQWTFRSGENITELDFKLTGKDNFVVDIYDNHGSWVRRFQIQDQHPRIQLGELPRGIYHFVATSGTAQSAGRFTYFR